MAIWDWVLEAYDRPGVPAATQTLQDAHGQNTSYLLWAVHAGTLDPDVLGPAAATARLWDRTALVPLRDVRRALKPALPPFVDSARESLRDSVKGLELAAERLLMETLDAMSPPGGGGGGGGDGATLAALEAASRAWGKPAPTGALADLAAALC